MGHISEVVGSEVVLVAVGAQLEVTFTQRAAIGYHSWKAVVEGDAILTMNGVTHRIGPADVHGYDPAAAVSLLNRTVEAIEVTPTGRLLFLFSGATRLELLTHESFESWRLFGPGNALVDER